MSNLFNSLFGDSDSLPRPDYLAPPYEDADPVVRGFYSKEVYDSILRSARKDRENHQKALKAKEEE